MCKPNTGRRGLLAIGIALTLVSLTGCGGDGDDDDPPILMPPPETDLTWDRGDWDELDWQ